MDLKIETINLVINGGKEKIDVTFSTQLSKDEFLIYLKHTKNTELSVRVVEQ